MSDRELYKLFSEFTAMAMIAHQTKVESEPQSVQMKFKKTAEAKDYLSTELPFSGNIDRY